MSGINIIIVIQILFTTNFPFKNELSLPNLCHVANIMLQFDYHCCILFFGTIMYFFINYI